MCTGCSQSKQSFLVVFVYQWNEGLLEHPQMVVNGHLVAWILHPWILSYGDSITITIPRKTRCVLLHYDSSKATDHISASHIRGEPSLGAKTTNDQALSISYQGRTVARS
jgi:hypothetical protein